MPACFYRCGLELNSNWSVHLSTFIAYSRYRRGHGARAGRTSEVEAEKKRADAIKYDPTLAEKGLLIQPSFDTAQDLPSTAGGW